MKRWRLILALVLVLIVVAWGLGSPLITLSAMKRAADARDAKALSAHIDYPALRKSVKQQLAERARAERGSVLGAIVSTGIADPIVDAAVSPTGMRLVFATTPSAEDAPAEGEGIKAQDMAYHRESWNRFSLVRPDGTALVFHLRGLSWMLTDVRLAPGAFH